MFVLGALWVLVACSAAPAPAPAPVDVGWSNPAAARTLRENPAAREYLQAVDHYAALPDADPVRVGDALLAIRYTGERAIEAGIEPLPVPCTALRAHPEARAAFSAVWGSTKDVEAASMREQCAGSALAAEKAALEAALERASPLPSGTMYQSMALSAFEPLDWLVLQPGGALVTGQEAALREAVVERVGDPGITAARDRLVGVAAREVQRQGIPAEEAQERAAAAVDLVIVTRLGIRE